MDVEEQNVAGSSAQQQATSEATSADRVKVGEVVEVDIGSIAHGGHCVARYQGQVIFVRHAIPGERALVEITAVNSKMARGDAITVISTSPHRVTPPCRFATPGGCGGCDFQHIDPPYARELKAAVIVEQFARLGGLTIQCEVHAVQPEDGLHWRTRMDFAIGESGHIGLFAHRSNEVIEIDQCLIADDYMDVPTLSTRKWSGDDRIEVASTSTGQVNISRAGRSISGPTQLEEIVPSDVGELSYQVSPQSFWQSHIEAPATLVNKVLSLIEAESGDVVCDLYGGVGLFTAALSKVVGVQGRVHLIESSPRAIADAQKIFKGVGNVEIHSGRVEARLPKISKTDVIVLDPPRTGAGEEVIDVMVRLHPSTIVYVSCDPASLARDAKLLLRNGYAMDHIVGYDLFPMTQHVECVARFRPL
jgi:tRNA/tmRNA/rRNA uracil-C5-methylase (TrmA/RlmC/RlmD family)